MPLLVRADAALAARDAAALEAVVRGVLRDTRQRMVGALAAANAPGAPDEREDVEVDDPPCKAGRAPQRSGMRRRPRRDA